MKVDHINQDNDWAAAPPTNIGWMNNINEFESILLDPSTSEEYYDLTMRHIRDIVMNNEIQYEIRDIAAKIMHQNSLDAKAAACLYEPSPLSSRKRKAVR